MPGILEIQEAKNRLRREMKLVLAGMPMERRIRGAVSIAGILASATSWKQASTVGIYSPLPEEMDITAVRKMAWASGKRLALPVFDAGSGGYDWREWPEDAETKVARFGNLEPVGTNRVVAEGLDFVLVPGLAFDMSGSRLGRGRGYYDRLLEGLGAATCGVGFDEQVIPMVPVEAHDVKLGELLTPLNWLRCGVGRDEKTWF